MTTLTAWRDPRPPSSCTRFFNQSVLEAELHAELQTEIAYHEEAVPCIGDDRSLWTSEDAGERELASLACASCPVVELCDTVAELCAESFGVWGGVDRSPSRTVPVTVGRPERLPNHCRRGHLLEGDNVYVGKTGRRTCRTCSQARARASARRKAEAKREREEQQAA